MTDGAFVARVRELKVHERAVRAPSRTRSESTRVFSSLDSLLGFLGGLPEHLELEVVRKRDRYILYIRQ